MRAVEIFDQIPIRRLPAPRLLPLLLLPLPLLRTGESRRLGRPLRAGLVHRSRQRVLVHPVQEALDDAEGDEPPHVDPPHRVRMLHAPALDTEALSQRQIQLRQPRATQRPLLPLLPVPVPVPLPLPLLPARPAPLTQSHIPPALRLHLPTLHKRRHLRRRRVNGPEAEDVEQQHAAVVEQVPDGLAHELEVGVGAQGDLADAVDAVEPGQDAQHGEVPVGVDEAGEADGGEGHVVGAAGRGRRVGGEELEVEGVGRVEGHHGLGVGVEVLEQDLAQGVEAAPAVAVAGQEPALLLQRAEEGVQFPRHGDVGAEVGVFGQHEAEVEGVGVARVAGGGDVLGVGEDAVVGVGEGQEAAVAEGRVGDDEGGDWGEVEEGDGGGGGGGGYGRGGDLVEDFGALWRRC